MAPRCWRVCSPSAVGTEVSKVVLSVIRKCGCAVAVGDGDGDGDGETLSSPPVPVGHVVVRLPHPCARTAAATVLSSALTVAARLIVTCLLVLLPQYSLLLRPLLCRWVGCWCSTSSESPHRAIASVRL